MLLYQSKRNKNNWLQTTTIMINLKLLIMFNIFLFKPNQLFINFNKLLLCYLS